MAEGREPSDPLARRRRSLERLAEEPFDVLVVGGGIVGAGAALDAASRGLRVALVEQEDVASGTSSRSSRLIHGGLRYLEDFRFGLVREALAERSRLRGLVAVAHPKDRGTRSFLERLKGQGLDAVETRHPSHDPETRARLTDIALALGLLRTGGSDWHGDPEPGETHGALGSQEVPLEWLERLDQHRLCEVP